jgi:2-(1,2-epoxy-1,2-dihydrophenyl)acetyl-CoA isomerase
MLMRASTCHSGCRFRGDRNPAARGDKPARLWLDRAPEERMTDLLERRDGGVLTLTLNRPDRMNAFSPAMLDALLAALRHAASDPEVGAVVLTGAGRGFCAGGDVKGMAERGDRNVEERVEELRMRHAIPRLLRTMPKVVIAMINGPAAGAGFSIALACDLRIAARSARMGTAFANVGFSGDFGGSWTLTRLVGTAKARELYFLGTMLDAAEAERLGIVTRVVEDDALHDETMALARRIAEGPRVAFGYMKRNLHAAETESFETVLDMEAEHQTRTGQTDDHREARQAFIEKRKPVFSGR